MAKTVSIGTQDFAKIRERDSFYVDKTHFIKEWWESYDDVTLITRPRRFGKTLNMSMLEYFFSNKYANRGDLFEGLSIWDDEKYRALQGTYPVIFLSFAGIKYNNYETTRTAMNGIITDAYLRLRSVLPADKLDEGDKKLLDSINRDMSDETASMSLHHLCMILEKLYKKKAIVLIDEYDTPMQEAWVNGYWDEMTAYIRSLFNSTFKTNPYLERGIMTGITRVSKESIFSDLNNLKVVTTTSDKYSTVFGFTEEEVFNAMDSQGMPEDDKEHVKFWYDGFTFGKTTDIYNPWSVTMYLDDKKLGAHWANTSSNSLVGNLLRTGDAKLKILFEKLLAGDCIEVAIDEQIIFNQLEKNKDAVWSLLLASGYLKIEGIIQEIPEDDAIYQMKLTNFEVRKMFEKMISGWFNANEYFGDFVSAMLKGDERNMTRYMNKVALNSFSYFDTGKNPSEEKEPERFYHGFVLGLMVDRAKDYILKSNRESGYGRYDVVLEPKDASNVAVIIEFKVLDSFEGEKSLEDTAANALAQIEEKKIRHGSAAARHPCRADFQIRFCI